MTSAADQARDQAASADPRRGNPARPFLQAALPTAGLLVAAHLYAMRQGPGWISPLLLADHLFDLALAVVVLWYCLVLGRAIAAPLLGLDGDRLTDTLAALGIGSGLLSTAVLCAGFLRLYYTPAFVLAALGLTVWLRPALTDSLRQALAALRRWSAAGMPTAPTLAQRLVLFILVLSMVLVLIDATVPVGWGSPMEWDAPAYHLAGPKLYMAAHRIVPLPDIPLANEPSAQEMLYLIGLFAGTDGLGKMLSVLFAPLLGLATFALGRRHFGSYAGWLAALLLWNVLWLGVEVPTSFPDFASFFLLVLSVSDALAWLYRETPWRGANGAPMPIRPGHTWYGMLRLGKADRMLMRSGLLLGFAVSAKLTNLPAVPALALAVGAVCMLREGRRVRCGIMHGVRAGGMLCIVALVVLAPWLLKNLYFFGHPFVGVAVQASVPAAGSVAVTDAAQQTALGHLWWVAQNLADIAWHTLTPLSLALLAAPLLLRRPSGRALQIFVLAGGTLWLLFVPRYIEPRYYVPVIAAAYVLIAAVVGEVVRRLPLRAALAELPLIAYLLPHSLLLLSVCVTQMNGNQALDVALGRAARATYLAARVRPYQAQAWVNEHTSPDAVIVLVGVTRGYYLDRTYLAEWYRTRRGRLDSGGAAARSELTGWCRAGATYLVLDRGLDEFDDDQVATIRPRASFTWLRTPDLQPRLLFSAHGVDVLGIQPCAVTGRR